MDTTFDDIIDRIDAVNVDLQVELSIEDSAQEIVRLQQDQLLHGQAANGKRIGKYKDPRYAAKKFALNPLAGYGNMDWILKGDLKNQVFTVVQGSEIVIDSADPKTGFLIKNIGDPFGLTSKNEDVLIENKLGEAFDLNMHEALNL